MCEFLNGQFSAGLVAMGGYLPGKNIRERDASQLPAYLAKQTRLHHDYLKPISENGLLPGTVETNYDGWQSQPWYKAWFDRLPDKKKSNPFAGIETRCRVPVDPESRANAIRPHLMLSSDAETLAGALALYNAGMDQSMVDLLMVSSLVPDRHVPLNASLVQHKLKLPNAGAYNIDTCCSSFITMLEMAVLYVRCGLKRNVMIIGSAIDSHISDKSNYYSPNTGDAAVAGIVSRVDEGYGYISSHSISQGARHAAIVFQRRRPRLSAITSQGPDFEQEFVTFNDPSLCKEIAENCRDDIVTVVDGALGKANYSREDIDFLVAHQPVHWAGNAWREALGIPAGKYHETFRHYGNIAVASVAVNLLDALEKGKVNCGDNVVMVSSGVGENHGALLQKISPRLLQVNGL
ncbi:3-oxoacyl-[acyl-carrier-protein] synthase III C-terminal domain-containing protein [Endozoicomonas sp. GU-1]|uniref:3-oxoacyl-ACP synthase III family protein n=1 Tax=Endozoicomonas sp. GU-1 TaxID=3009078 RepID=UPI0022B4A6C8|nr:3-oxoacyl-[acyl-carrier-protein] synthase III C-terminal domain-containing protein [Endozoicomonas sp. GU-1]WBA83256.1 hypothetical protein O2T12_09120 [Endozoicomonas sp. GU-1]WBA86183.1 hypothetical protein O3276_23760 [Endozoicomonas sp. GU-1]